MIKHATAVAFALLLASLSFGALARGGPSGGMSAGHISASGIANTNGPNSLDRDKGFERAEDRMSVEGASHEKAHQRHEKGKHERPQIKLDEERHEAADLGALRGPR